MRIQALRPALGTLFCAVLIFCAAGAARGGEPNAQLRAKAAAAQKAGNFKDAYELFAQLALDPQDDAVKAGDDLANAIRCLNNLGRTDEIDDFREKVVAAHADNWRLLQAAVQSLLENQHQGHIFAGKFYRGNQRGGDGRWVNCYERDRVRILQLMQQALVPASAENDQDARSRFFSDFASDVVGANLDYGHAWRLQDLTDLTKLPDYEEGWYQGGGGRGWPVAADGGPLYFKVPASFEASANDGERWRWLLNHAMEVAPARAAQLRAEFANFWREHLDVYTMAGFGRFNEDDETKKDESGPYAVSTLGEDETIARLATGIKRFKLPDEFNFIRILQEVAEFETLAKIFEDRQQYDKAADYWRRSIERDGDANHYKQQRVDQILGNWGVFEPVMTQPAAAGATVDFRFRNGGRVSFEAYEIKVAKLLEDVKDYIRSKPKNMDWNMLNIGDIGYRLVEKDETKYLGAQAAAWDLDLQPREKHFDRRVTVTTPLKKAGAYLLTAKMANGNTSRIVLWVADTTLVKKQLDKQVLCFVADAVTGQPVPDAQLDFFGYRQEWEKQTPRIIVNETRSVTGVDGQCFLTEAMAPNNNQWLITATAPGGRFAFLGFTGVWYGQYYDNEYNQKKAFGITDRPVYRPGHTVKYKFWVAQAQYDREGRSPYAGRYVTLRFHNPRGEKITEVNLHADEFGGVSGEFPLPKDAMLGVYQLAAVGLDACTFRVEEYKKPEFEVKVEAPSEPLALGDKFTAKVSAKYYFGAPVTEAKVKYKVLRYEHTANWYPTAYWDWFYEPGYWWFAYDYLWYPGWRQWGCARPWPFWWGRSSAPPEVVSENEVPLGADGTLNVEIDTAPAKAVHGDTDHRYEITAEVTDQSRRTIVGTGTVLAARQPFRVYAWVDRGHYRTGDAIHADFCAQTPDHKPVKGTGTLRLFQVTYGADQVPVETKVQEWPLDTNDEGRANLQLKASEAGQYRLSYTVTPPANPQSAIRNPQSIEGAYVFIVTGPGFDGSGFRFNDLELVADKREYAPGETVHLRVNTNRADGAVLLFVRAANGVCLPPKLLRLKGKSALEEIDVVKKDMPNFFIEAVTVSGGKIFSEVREIVVPPEKRVVNVEVLPNATELKPGEKTKVKVRLTDLAGAPVVGTTAVTVYDKSVEYISGGSNVPEIKAFFWKWRRRHYPQTECSLSLSGYNLLKSKEIGMSDLGVFGAQVADDILLKRESGVEWHEQGRGVWGNAKDSFARGRMEAAAPASGAPMAMEKGAKQDSDMPEQAGEPGAAPPVEPAVRTNFADTALWIATLNTDKNGTAEFDLPMPESLTTWKVKVWTMAEGTRVGQGEAEVITRKNVIIRLQAPRFFVEKDEVVLSANVHNYLKTKKKVKVMLELHGRTLMQIFSDHENRDYQEFMRGMPPGNSVYRGYPKSETEVEIEPNSETRVDWRVMVSEPGEATVRVKALTDEESDAMEMKFPAYVHGMLKTDSFSGAMRPETNSASITFTVPAERRAAESRLEVRYSPTLAGALVDALPYLVDYPYGCTEQTLSRFLPTVITQKVLLHMNLNLAEIRKKITNLNAQEIGDDVKRAREQGEKLKRAGQVAHDAEGHAREISPVFDEAEVAAMAAAGIERLSNMQCADGGWGWFSGWGEQSYPHTTAYVVHGLQIARSNRLALPPNMLERGVTWLKNYQTTQLDLLKRAPLPTLSPEGRGEQRPAAQTEPYKLKADNLDAFVHMVLTDAGQPSAEMREFLYRDRNELAVYSKAMFGLALLKEKQTDKLNMIIQNIEQFLVQDDENQTAYLKLPENNWWWYWYGSEYEAQAYYLKLLAATDPKSEKASRLVKYLINNRRHASYWNSTRDTAVCIEALAEYLTASGEVTPDLQMEITLDGKPVKQVAINAANLFSFDNQLLLTGDALTAGPHTLNFKKTGAGPLYFNAYVSNFTLEDHITKAGLEIKVNRKYYKLIPVEKKVSVEGARGQSVAQKVEKYERRELADLATLKSGDLAEIELEIDSKNDYEYLLFEDMKAAGFEPVEVRSGYNGNDLGAYMELRDERVAFFVRALARGKHSVAYRMRAEIPGKFSALPTRASAMYAPELRANSDEIKLNIED